MIHGYDKTYETSQCIDDLPVPAPCQKNGTAKREDLYACYVSYVCRAWCAYCVRCLSCCNLVGDVDVTGRVGLIASEEAFISFIFSPCSCRLPQGIVCFIGDAQLGPTQCVQ